MLLRVTLLALYLCASLSSPFAAGWKRGIVFGGDEWTAPGTGFGTPSAAASLSALAATGADHVRLLTTQYQLALNATTIFPIQPPSPLASSSLASLRDTIRACHAHNLSVFLAPILDPSWDVATNGRSITPPAGARAVSRLLIGQAFTEADWTAWFESYAAFVLPLAQLASDEGVDMFEVASELDVALTTRAPQWRALIARVRAVYAGPLYVAANTGTLELITFWDVLDAVGVDAYYGLGDTLPLGVAPTVDALVTAWVPIAASLATIAASTGKPILITEVGYQSRPSCHVRPWGTVVHDPLDDSAWLEDHDMACQANAYEALLRVFTPLPWFSGVFFWLWHADSTSGGTGDSDFTPHGKPAEVVLRKWYAQPTEAKAGPHALLHECTDGGAYGVVSDFLSERATAHPSWWTPADGMTQAWAPVSSDGAGSACDGSAAVAAAVQAAGLSEMEGLEDPRADGMPPGLGAGTRRMYNGYVFGGPDQWSSPSYRYDSAGARASLAALAASGADTVEIIVQWYVRDYNSTTIYAITDESNPLRTSTDSELASIIAAAHELKLKTMLTLMLDPDWTLPAQNWCRGNPNHIPGCHWRGEIGEPWGDSCTPGSQWAAFFDGYSAAVVRYARLANECNVSAYLLSHELQRATEVCPELWASQLAAVRGVYSGAVSTAFNPDGPAILPPSVSGAAWVRALDFIGVDCYLNPSFLPWVGPGGLSPTDVHPPLPWQDLDDATLMAAFAALMPPYAALSRATGDKKIVCTEIGWASRPWTYAYRAGTPRLDGEDCSVTDQCVNQHAQALALSAFLRTYYAQPWFEGVTFWTWRADPTVGGASDDGFSPAGKEAASVARTFWGGASAADMSLASW